MRKEWKITPPIGYLYVFLLRKKNDRRCKANVLNGCDDNDGTMVFEVGVGSYRCCCLSCIYSEVCEISCRYIGYNYIIKIVIILYFVFRIKGDTI